jgi:hypothetical protein
MSNVVKWLLGTLLVVLSSIGWADQEANAAPAANVQPVTMSCWFEAHAVGPFEGVCGDVSKRPANYSDVAVVELPEGIDPAMVRAWRALGAYSVEGDQCECLYVPVEAGLGNTT